jgi:uncharacterized protein YifE (UPF0438 family)
MKQITVIKSTASVTSEPEKRLQYIAGGGKPRTAAEEVLKKQVDKIKKQKRIIDIPSM